MVLGRSLLLILTFFAFQASEALQPKTRNEAATGGLLGVAYTNDLIGGCPAGYVTFSDTETTIKINGEEKKLPVHGLTVFESTRTSDVKQKLNPFAFHLME